MISIDEKPFNKITSNIFSIHIRITKIPEIIQITGTDLGGG